MKQKNFITILMALMVTFLLAGCASKDIEEIINYFENDSVYLLKKSSYSMDMYNKYKDKPAFEKAVSKRIDKIVAEGNDEPGYHISCFVIQLEEAEYYNSNIKNKIDELFMTKIEKMRAEGEGEEKINRLLNKLENFEFYSTQDFYQPDSYVIDAYAAKMKKTIEQGDVSEFINVVNQLNNAGDDGEEEKINMPGELTEAEVREFIQSNCEKAILKKGVGGFYDGEKDSSSGGQNGVELNSSSQRYMGDFKLSVSSKNYMVLTDDGWKDAGLDKYDEEKESVYFKDDIKVTSHVAKFMEAISTNDFSEIYVPERGGIVMLGDGFIKINTLYCYFEK